jgi:hypothetical protein
VSVEGVKKVAKVFEQMQMLRIELLGPRGPGGAVDRQDVELSALLDRMKDFANEDFIRIVGGE